MAIFPLPSVGMLTVKPKFSGDENRGRKEAGSGDVEKSDRTIRPRSTSADRFFRVSGKDGSSYEGSGFENQVQLDSILMERAKKLDHITLGMYHPHVEGGPHEDIFNMRLSGAVDRHLRRIGTFCLD